MSRFLVEYDPSLSTIAKRFIVDKVTESMVSNDGASCQYHLDMVKECLEENELFDDLKIIKTLLSEDVVFIELCVKEIE
jgi:hypothetical protein